MRPMKNIFTVHPSAADETYLQHLKRACVFSGWMILGGLACLVHAVFPFLFTETASKIVSKLYISY